MHEDPNAAPPDARNLRIGIVTSRYHEAITSALRRGAEKAFLDAGGLPNHLLSIEAPGSYELVPITAAMLQRADIDAVVALGCIVTGDTHHDRYLASAVAHALADLAARSSKPVAFGILTVQTLNQARERAGGAKGNKAVEAMHAAIRTAVAIQSLAKGGR